MAIQRESVETRLLAVERMLGEIDSRLRALESESPQPLFDGIAPAAAVDTASQPVADVAGTLTLVGRTLLIIAGAYLLRALSASAVIRPGIGVALGLAYAASWTVVAYRTAPRRPLSATFFGVATALISLSLTWEATSRLALLTPLAGASVLTMATAILLFTAWRRRLRALAWITTVGACVTGGVLLFATLSVITYTTFLIFLGIATLWLGYDREWTVLRWVTAAVADLAVLVLIARVLATPPRDDPAGVMSVQVLMLIAYLGSIAIRTLARGRDVVPFEVVQSAVMLPVALGGALTVAHHTGAGAAPLAVALLGVAAGCYVVEFVDRRQTRGANRYFYTSLALVFALTGAELIAAGSIQAALWLLFAVIAGWLARRSDHPTLAVHAVVYLIAAAISSGLLVTTTTGWFAAADAAWRPVEPAAWAVLAVLALLWLMPPRTATSAQAVVARAVRFLLAVVGVVVGAAVCIVLARWLMSFAGVAPSAGGVATVRTGVIAVGALAVAWLGRAAATREFGALLYPLLGYGAVKLVIEDLRLSSPLLLVVAFALYGGALILGPRVAQSGRGRAA